MNAFLVVVGLESFQLPIKIHRIPEERTIEVFARNRPNQSLDEGMRHRSVRYGLDLPDLEDPQVGELKLQEVIEQSERGLLISMRVLRGAITRSAFD